MHAARLNNSARLQLVLNYLLKKPDGATSMEIVQNCRVVAPATVVSELRHQGYAIDCRRDGDIWRYRVTG